ncbi:MAG: hypothetical protein WDN75_21870 [Bacteroidota bacterium]
MKLDARKIHIHPLLAMAICLMAISANAQYPSYTRFRTSVFKTEASADLAAAELKKFKNDTSKVTRLNETGQIFYKPLAHLR